MNVVGELHIGTKRSVINPVPVDTPEDSRPSEEGSVFAHIEYA